MAQHMIVAMSCPRFREKFDYLTEYFSVVMSPNSLYNIMGKDVAKSAHTRNEVILIEIRKFILLL